MAYKVEILPVAWEDLKRIEDWYLVQWFIFTILWIREQIMRSYFISGVKVNVAVFKNIKFE